MILLTSWLWDLTLRFDSGIFVTRFEIQKLDSIKMMRTYIHMMCDKFVLLPLYVGCPRFNKGVTEKSTQSQFWLSQSLLIACGSFIANFEPALKSRIFEIAILKISTVLYHVKISWLGSTRITLDFWYVVCNKHLNKPAKNQASSRGFPEFIAKKRSRGQPRLRVKLRLEWNMGKIFLSDHSVLHYWIH